MSKKKIVVLPDAGPENPFQYEMVKLLKNNNFEVNVGQKYSILSTYKAVRQYAPDIVYYDWVHSFIIGKSLAWSIIKSLVFVFEIIYLKYFKKIRIVHTLHNLQNHAGLYLGLERIVYRFFLKKCDKIRVYSDTTKQAAIQRFNLKSSRFYIIQDLPYHYYYPNNIDSQNARNELNIDQKTFVYLFFGEIKPYKGLDVFLPIFLQNVQENDLLIVAGKSYDADYFAKLQSLTQHSKQVLWYHRFIEDNELQNFFNAADVVVLPFLRIDHSGSIDLAMSFRKAVVTLANDVTKNTLKNQQTLLFNDVTQIAKCLVNAKNADLMNIGEQNFKTADATNYLEIINLFENVS